MDPLSIRLRRRFWIEATLGALTGLLAVLTLVWTDWIEVIFGVDPDHGSGSLERVIVIAAFVVTVAFGVAANIEWRKARSLAGAGRPAG